jgi:hypothetical protein
VNVDPQAGKPVAQSMLVNVPRLMTAYFARRRHLQEKAHAIVRDALRVGARS